MSAAETNPAGASELQSPTDAFQGTVSLQGGLRLGCGSLLHANSCLPFSAFFLRDIKPDNILLDEHGKCRVLRGSAHGKRQSQEQDVLAEVQVLAACLVSCWFLASAPLGAGPSFQASAALFRLWSGSALSPGGTGHPVLLRGLRVPRCLPVGTSSPAGPQGVPRRHRQGRLTSCALVP